MDLPRPISPRLFGFTRSWYETLEETLARVESAIQGAASEEPVPVGRFDREARIGMLLAPYLTVPLLILDVVTLPIGAAGEAWRRFGRRASRRS